MKKFIASLLLASCTLFTTACDPVERQAYNTVVAAKGFIDAVKAVHPECATGTASPVCEALKKATAAKDSVIDAAEVYCAGPNFETGGECDAPKKGTPGAEQAVAKLKAAINIYVQFADDLKGVL